MVEFGSVRDRTAPPAAQGVHLAPTATAESFAALLDALHAGQHVTVLPGHQVVETAPGAGDSSMPAPVPLSGELGFPSRPRPPGAAGDMAERLGAALGLSAEDRLMVSRLSTPSDIYLAMAAWQAGAELAFLPWAADQGPLEWVQSCAKNRSTVAALDQSRLLQVATDLRDRPENFDLSALRVLLVDNGTEPISSEALRVFNDTAMEYGFDEMAICTVYHAGGVWPVSVMKPDVLWRCRVVDVDALASGRWVETLGNGGEVVALGSPMAGLTVCGTSDGELGTLEITGPDDVRWPTGDRGICVQGEVHLVPHGGEPALG